MTIEGTEFRCSLGAYGEGPHPCATCGGVGQEIWIGTDGQCAGCRIEKGKTNMSQMMVVREHEDLVLPEAKSRAMAEWFEQWVGPDALAFEITDQETLEMAGQALGEIKEHAKEIEAGEKSFTAPLLGVVARLRDVFRPARLLAGRAEEIWKKKILDSNERRRLAAAEAAKQVEAALKAGDTRTAIIQHAKIQPVERVQGLQTRKTWKATITNPDLVPDTFKVIDMGLVNAAMRAQLKAAPKQTPVIAGVKFELVEGLAVV